MEGGVGAAGAVRQPKPGRDTSALLICAAKADSTSAKASLPPTNHAGGAP